MTIPGETPTILTLCNSDHALLPLFLLLLHTSPLASAQLPNTLPPPPPPTPGDTFTRLRFDKSMAIILVILVVVFFVLGFISVYSRQCAEQRIRGIHELTNPVGSSSRRPCGLDPEIINTFPTFVYSTVKGLKIGRSALECAVCLNEFQDDETLRFIPKCSHVFHPDCIDLWLSSHSTCPVCRANLVPIPGDMSFVTIQIPVEPDIEPDPTTDSEEQHNNDNVLVDDNGNRVAESSKVNLLNRSATTNQNSSPRSRSTGFQIASLFPRSHSTGHSLVAPGENHERFTLRLPDEVRKQLLNSTLNRTKSCVTFTRMSSERRGYRIRSVGSGHGMNSSQYERFSSEVERPDRRGFTWTPPFINRSGSSRSWKGSTECRKPTMDSSEVRLDNLGERSSDKLCPGRED